jgi:hypothetical protein
MRKILTGILSLAACAVIMLGVLPQKASALSYTYFRNGNSNSCMNVNGGVYANWTAVNQATCLWQVKQQFYWVDSGFDDVLGNPYYYIKAAGNPNYCVSIANLLPDNNIPTILWTCQGTANQLFQKLYVPPQAGAGFFFLWVKSSNKVLQVNGASINDGAAITQWAPAYDYHYYWY